MKINHQKLVKQLQKRWKDVDCPYCKDHNWTVDPIIVTLPEVSSDMKVRLGGRFQPLIPVTCRCCGYTAFVNAIILNCVETEDDGKKEE